VAFAHPLPAEAGRYGFVTHDYRIEGARLVAQPRVHSFMEALAMTPAGWMGLGYEVDGARGDLYLHRLDGTRGPPIVDWGWIDGGSVVVPASRGQLWLLGAFGSHVRVDPGSLRRIGGTSLRERLRDFDARFDQLGRYSDWYTDGAWRKRSVIPLVLLGLPVCLVTALVVWAVRRRGAGALFGGLGLAYLALALLSLPLFWEVTGRL
jgi:hypothetical protein